MDILAKAELIALQDVPWNVATASWTLFDQWESISLQRGSAITPDLTLSSITVNETGPYSATVFLNCAFDRTEEMSIGISVNGAEPANWLQEQGRGANKPIDFSWYGIHNLTAGDVLTVVGKMESTDTEVTVLSATFTVAKEF